MELLCVCARAHQMKQTQAAATHYHKIYCKILWDLLHSTHMCDSSEKFVNSLAILGLCVCVFVLMQFVKCMRAHEFCWVGWKIVKGINKYPIVAINFNWELVFFGKSILCVCVFFLFLKRKSHRKPHNPVWSKIEMVAFSNSNLTLTPPNGKFPICNR